MSHQIIKRSVKKRLALRGLPDYPEIVSNENLDALDVAAIRAATAKAGKHSVMNGFLAAGAEKFGRPEYLDLSSIIVSLPPFKDFDPEDTRIDSHSEKNIHVLFRTRDDRTFPLVACASVTQDRTVRGIVVKDEKGRGWLCGNVAEGASAPGEVLEDASFVFTGEEPLLEISLETAPVVADFFLNDSVTPLLDKLPTFAGEFLVHGVIIAGTTGAKISPVTAGHDHLMPGLIRMNERIDEILDRERLIESAIEDVLTEDAIREMFGVRQFPITEDIYPAFGAPGRREFEDRKNALAKRVAIALRDAGLCAPCPNNGPHDVYGMKAWDTFLKGEIDGPASSYDGAAFYAARELEGSPFFNAFERLVSDVTSDLHETAWREANPSKEYDFKAIVPISEERYAAAIIGARSAMVSDLSREDASLLDMTTFRSRLDSSIRPVIANSFLKPVLATRSGGELIPLPNLEEPKHVRLLKLSVPSGRLAVAEWPRVEGFTEGVQEICEGDNYDLSTADDFDLRARHYYERMGVAIIQVTNGPEPYRDVPGVIRFGHVDEDHEDLWTEKNGKDVYLGPKPAFRVSGPVWCRIMADVETFVDVMMASGKYGGREEAMSAFESHAASSDEVAIIDLEGGEVYLYAPTGFGVNKGSFRKKFWAAEMDFQEWRRDEFALSDRPLDVDLSTLEENDWQEGRIDPIVTLRGDQADEPQPW